MRGHEFLELKRQIQSLSDSTDLSIGFKDACVRIYQRNSPLISHQGVSFASTAEIVREVGGYWFRNDVATVILCPAYSERLPKTTTITKNGRPVKAERRVETVAVSLLESLYEAASFYMGLPRHSGRLVSVAFYVPILARYDEDGSPVFEKGDERDRLPIAWFDDSNNILAMMVKEEEGESN